MRRISTGVQGRPILGKYFSLDNVLSTLQENTDIVLEPSGTGKISADADVRISSGNSLEIVSDSSSNSVNLVAPSGMGSDLTLTLPSSSGTAGDVLTVDGSGNLSFADLTIEVADQTADTSAYYPLLSTSNSGSISDVSTSSSKLSFRPNSGTLTATNITVTSSFEAATITETSSEILKTEIQPIDNALASVSALSGVSYTRIATGQRELGLIAEQVEKIIPELVSDTGAYKSISYSRLSAYLIEAVKDLKEEIADIKTKTTQSL